ncbi:histone chaperone domain CHZ-domain-containing protein [Xylariaceae sp. FL0662B]|nr:histone chaperone domain CHZ-domain-containing protein [Xylariaceae sp. FL0662B]
MTTENGVTVPQDTTTKAADDSIQTKGKGKAPATEEPVDQSMDEDDDEDEEEEGDGGDDDADADDGMDEIDLNNIVEGGRRTRGRVIDWAKAAEENPAADEDDEDEDDYEPAQAEDDGDKMDED